MTVQRPAWDDYFMEIAQVAAKRSTCLRRQVGAVITREQRILATGYNGAPQKLAHCAEIGCLRSKRQIPSGERHELCRAVHAEQNAIIQAATYGVSLKGGTLYCTNQPCVLCARLIINAQLERVVYRGDYPDEMAREMLAEAGIECIHYTPDASNTSDKQNEQHDSNLPYARQEHTWGAETKIVALPKLNRLNPTLESTALKLMEEAGELAQGIGKFRGLSGEKDCFNDVQAMDVITKELLDVAQTAVSMMFVLEEKHGVNIDHALTEHWEKLKRKGYLQTDSPLNKA